MIEPIVHEVVHDCELVMPGRTQDDRLKSGMGRQILQHANRKQRAILAVVILLRVGTARHVTGHRRHVGHRDIGRSDRGHWRGQWGRDKPRDHEDR